VVTEDSWKIKIYLNAINAAIEDAHCVPKCAVHREKDAMGSAKPVLHLAFVEDARFVNGRLAPYGQQTGIMRVKIEMLANSF
jgi:hypothetical protein